MLEGGINALLKVDPMTAKDKAASPAAAAKPAAAASSSSSSSDRFAFASKPAASSNGNGVKPAASSKFQTLKPIDAKAFALNKGYILVDVRSSREHDSNSKKWFVNIPADSDSRFSAAVSKAYPFKSARLIIVSTGGACWVSLRACGCAACEAHAVHCRCWCAVHVGYRVCLHESHIAELRTAPWHAPDCCCWVSLSLVGRCQRRLCCRVRRERPGHCWLHQRGRAGGWH